MANETFLSTLISAGESQSVEFKVSFPQQSRDLAREIAAFSTSNDGKIFVGVDDAGAIIGIDNISSTNERDAFLLRIQGICANSVKPPALVEVEFAALTNKRIAILHVKRGKSPIYYVNNVPYLRAATSSRPAEPQEVIDAILQWHKTDNRSDKTEETAATLLLSALIRSSIETEDAEGRDTNPWLDSARGRMGYLADELRDIYFRFEKYFVAMERDIVQLIESLDAAAHERIGLNFGWDEFESSKQSANELANKLVRSMLTDNNLLPSAVEQIFDGLKSQIRRLQDLSQKSIRLEEAGRTTDIQQTAGDIGYHLLIFCKFGMLLEKRIPSEFEREGRALREIETRQIYMDGGASSSAVVSDVRSSLTTLEPLLGDIA